jgi:hypothetical protein
VQEYDNNTSCFSKRGLSNTRAKPGPKKGFVALEREVSKATNHPAVSLKTKHQLVIETKNNQISKLSLPCPKVSIIYLFLYRNTNVPFNLQDEPKPRSYIQRSAIPFHSQNEKPVFITNFIGNLFSEKEPMDAIYMGKTAKIQCTILGMDVI